MMWSETVVTVHVHPQDNVSNQAHMNSYKQYFCNYLTEPLTYLTWPDILISVIITTIHRRTPMATRKYSRQRESIKSFLAGRFDHPTAETIYSCLREEQPHLSLGTVYRNLSLLTELGEIRKISTGDGPDHFDGDTSFHHHFICRQCHQVRYIVDCPFIG